MAAVDHYRVLGVDPAAPVAELRRAYVAEARRWHPDQHLGATDAQRRRAEERMRLVNEAWHVLGDVRRRADHDRALGLAPGPTSSGPVRVHATAADPSRHAAADDDEWSPEDLDDAGVALRGGRLVMAPVGLLALAAVSFWAWWLVAAEVFMVATVTFASLGAMGFLLLPLWAMVEARRSER